MSLFSRKTRWSNAEFIPFKLCVASIYVIIGAYFHDFVMEYRWPITAVFVVTVVWVVVLWLRKMKEK